VFVRETPLAAAAKKHYDAHPPMFRTLLIANRGEIACRIARTAKAMGLRTIAVYSDADAHAAHVEAADEAVRIGPASARESYLRMDAILAAAKATGAEAIHPGYGFLSENAEFAEACAAAGLVFVGPPASAIRAMGLKDRAKALMEAAGVPVVPGYHGRDQSGLANEAAKIGYPVLIKASAGGGGKGMRRVEHARDFADALAGARREAASAFGDDCMLIEKYVTRPRHVEVQVFADMHGNTVHLLERDCSLQRRHQKVIEEAPAPGMSDDLRAVIGAVAVKAARAVGYVGAGTVEFIADASEGLRADLIWFMEMNTRLQVEHPVTEAITGFDLVEWQLRVAAGEPLPKRQDEIRAHGHAVEARLYAENPGHDFLPSTGTLERFVLPTGVRVDTGVREGDTVTPFYDPLLAKVVAHGPTRAAAIDGLANALAAAEIAGPHTNTGFLVRVLRHPQFRSGDIDTHFIPAHPELGAPPALPERVLAAAANVLMQGRVAADDDPWGHADDFRLAGSARRMIEFIADGERRAVAVPAPSHGTLPLALRLSSGDIAVVDEGETFVLHPHDPLYDTEAEEDAGDSVVAPMPGRVVQVHVKAGQEVRRGDALMVLEAMKMEHTLSAPRDGTVENVGASAGDQITEGVILVRFAGVVA
jgi:acetyl-CoA carboxylase biotin carboxylase subunit